MSGSRSFRAAASRRMASLTSRRNMTSRVGMRRVLPFSVTAIFLAQYVLQDRADRSAPFRATFRITAFAGRKLRRFRRPAVSDDVVGGVEAFSIIHGCPPPQGWPDRLAVRRRRQQSSFD